MTTDTKALDEQSRELLAKQTRLENERDELVARQLDNARGRLVARRDR